MSAGGVQSFWAPGEKKPCGGPAKVVRRGVRTGRLNSQDWQCGCARHAGGTFDSIYVGVQLEKSCDGANPREAAPPGGAWGLGGRGCGASRRGAKKWCACALEGSSLRFGHNRAWGMLEARSILYMRGYNLRKSWEGQTPQEAFRTDVLEGEHVRGAGQQISLNRVTPPVLLLHDRLCLEASGRVPGPGLQPPG